MDPFAPRRALALVITFAFLLGTLPSAFAGDAWQPDTSCADKFKVGKSGQVYSWRKGKC